MRDWFWQVDLAAHFLKKRPRMAKSERDYLLELWAKNVCPHCGNPIPEGKRVGAGDRGKGGFCSLDCYARYYERN